MTDLVDIHCHVMYGIDDGAAGINDSAKMLAAAKKAGVKAICLTPHVFETEPPDIRELGRKAESLKNEHITVHTGGEVMIENDLDEFFENNRGFCLGEGNYVLIELPMFNYPVYVKSVLYNLKLKGFLPIIAHPERNRVIQKMKKKDCCRDIVENGYIQINAGSLTGRYGRRAKKTAKTLIKKGMVTFVASDAHEPTAYDQLKEAYGIYEKIKGEEAADVFGTNPGKALRGEYIQTAL